MSSVRGLRGGRGRGSGFNAQQNNAASRGGSNRFAQNRGSTRGALNGSRGGKETTNAGRGTFAPRGPRNNAPSTRGNAPPTTTRGNRGNRGGSGQTRGGTVFAQKPGAPRPATTAGGPRTQGTWAERREQLNTVREEEKRDAIARGLMSDPDKAIALSEAITLVGTCQDMCPESERITRAYQNNIWDEEKDANGKIAEMRMVKVFKRSDAGAAAQLPSDLRPPSVLKKTCDYLFNELLANAESPGDVHGFIWDRARAIRNDFSIQQVTKAEDMRIAIDCFERIARFHIASLHEFAKVEKPYDGYVSQQEREQLDRTLLSLMQYYDDSRGRLDLPNEPEFRAYCVVFQIQDPTPDLEDRLQNWPREVSGTPRVRTALEIYTAAQATKLAQGPMEPRQPHVLARQHWEQFWALLQSRKVSFLLGCVAEVYFNLVREMALSSIVYTARPPKKQQDGQWAANAEWHIEEIMSALGFDDEEEVQWYLQQWGLNFRQSAKDGNTYLDLSEAAHKPLPPRKTSDFPDQLRSGLVDRKRYGRTLTALMGGKTVSEAQQAGMIVGEEEMEEGNEGGDDGEENEEEMEDDANVADTNADGEEEDDSLFIPETKAPGPSPFQSAFPSNATQPAASPFSAFGAPSSAAAGQPTTLPNSSTPQFSAFSKPSASSTSAFSGFGRPSTSLNLFQPSTTTAAENQGIKTTAAPSFFNPAPPATQPPSLGTAAPVFKFGASSSASAQGTPAFGQPSSTTEPAKTTTIPGPFTEGLSTPSSNKPQGVFTSEGAASGPSWNFPKNDAPAKASAPAAPSLNAQQEANLKSTLQAQPQPQAPTSNSLLNNNQNAPLSDNGAQTAARRTSESHKPKNPSPLSQSFTAGDDNTSASHLPGGSAFRGHPSDKQATNIKPPVPPSERAETPPPREPPREPPSVTDFESILTKLAVDLTDAPIDGLLEQYVRHRIKQLVAETQEKVRLHLIQEHLAGLRLKVLEWKFGGKWREQYLRARFTKKRSQFTERRRRGLQASQAGKSVLGNRSVHRKQKATTSARNEENMVNHLRVTASEAAANGNQAQSGNKRPTTQNEPWMASREPPESRRPRSMGHVGVSGAVSKTSSPTGTHSDRFKRSSFLGYSAANSGTYPPSTTVTPYFKMKAMGFPMKRANPVADSEPDRSVKRARSDSNGTSTARAPPKPRSSVLGLSSSRRHDSESMPPPVTKPTAPKADVDEPLLARLKAAREALGDSTGFPKDKDNKAPLRESLGDSRSSNESPSLMKARAEARMRASGSSYGTSTDGASKFGVSHDVPAYRSRQSKFLTAEEQAQAVERAYALRSSRGSSRENSRPGSRADARAEVPSTSRTSHQDLSVKQPSTTRPASSNAFSGPSNGTTAPSRNPFSQDSSFAPRPPAQNPFLQATASPFSFGNHSQPKHFPSHDNTIQPSQVNNALSGTLGSPVRHSTQGGRDPGPSHAQTVSLLSDDEDNGNNVAFGQEQFFGAAAGKYPGSFAPGNHVDGYEEELEDDDNEADEGEMGEAGEEEEGDYTGNGVPNSYQHSNVEGDYEEEELEDDQELDGDADEEDANDEQVYYDDDEEEEFDDEDEEVDYGQPPANYTYNQRHAPTFAPKTFDGPDGASAEEAIELSD